MTPLAFSPVPLDEEVDDADELPEYLNVMNKSINRLIAKTYLYTVVTDITTTNNNRIQFYILFLTSGRSEVKGHDLELMGSVSCSAALEEVELETTIAGYCCF